MNNMFNTCKWKESAGGKERTTCVWILKKKTLYKIYENLFNQLKFWSNVTCRNKLCFVLICNLNIQDTILNLCQPIHT